MIQKILQGEGDLLDQVQVVEADDIREQYNKPTNPTPKKEPKKSPSGKGPFGGANVGSHKDGSKGGKKTGTARF